MVSVIHRLDIEYRHALFYRKSAGTNDAPGCLVNHNDFVACGVNDRQKMNFNRGVIGQQGGYSLYRALVMRFYADYPFFRAHRFARQVKRLDYLRRVEFKKLSVQPEKRFALRAVEKYDVRLIGKFGVSGESRSARSDDTCLSIKFSEFF